MDQTEHEHKESAVLAWVVIFLLVAVILTQGLFSFYVVGDKGQPTWDYRPVKDVPGESPYAIYPPQPYPQHVRGGKQDYPQTPEGWDQSLFPPPKQIVTGE